MPQSLANLNAELSQLKMRRLRNKNRSSEIAAELETNEANYQARKETLKSEESRLPETEQQIVEQIANCEARIQAASKTS